MSIWILHSSNEVFLINSEFEIKSNVFEVEILKIFENSIQDFEASLKNGLEKVFLTPQTRKSSEMRRDPIQDDDVSVFFKNLQKSDRSDLEYSSGTKNDDE